MLLVVEQFLNGLQFGLLLFLLAAGLTLVFGIMDLVNLAHGSLYMMGAYFAATFVAWTGSFVLGAVMALGATLLLGIVLEFTALRHLYGRDHLDHVLATFGLILFFNEAVRLIWGPAGLALPLPSWLAFPVTIMPGIQYPAYRLAIIVVALLVALLLYLGVMRFQVGWFDRRIKRDAPGTEFVRATEAKWKALAPAIDAHYYPVEILEDLFESLPSADVRITAYNQSARQVSVDGEANTAALAYEFIDKIKKNPELRTFQFDIAAPRILANSHAQFRVEGKPK